MSRRPFLHTLIILAVLVLLSFVSCQSGDSKAEYAKMPDSTAVNFTDGSIASPGYTYNWTSNGPSAGLGNGTYTVSVTNASGANSSEETKVPEGGGKDGQDVPPPVPPPLQAKPQVKTPDKIIKTGNLNIEVDDYDKSRAAVEALVKKSEGYISHEDESGNSYSKQSTMTIRVPAAAFDKTMSGLSGIAKTVRSRSVNVADVSEEYYDVEARKNAQKAAEQRYIELLKQAKTVGEIMEVQSKIDQIQEEVESKEGRLRVINDQVGYSTIMLSLTKNFEYVQEDRPGFWGRIGNAFGNGWQGLQWFFIGFASLWPLWLVLGFVFWIVRRAIRRYLAKSKAPQS
ncbi:MAG: hypothetical protein FD123_3209 [Bacteroidetes bacterium]|nr:MAG: hypothetical protein FD123_3209 [Bacteroidota bacterium]